MLNELLTIVMVYRGCCRNSYTITSSKFTTRFVQPNQLDEQYVSYLLYFQLSGIRVGSNCCNIHFHVIFQEAFDQWYVHINSAKPTPPMVSNASADAFSSLAERVAAEEAERNFQARLECWNHEVELSTSVFVLCLFLLEGVLQVEMLVLMLRLFKHKWPNRPV